MRPSLPRRILNSLAVVSVLTALFLGLMFWKIDYLYEVALFHYLARITPEGLQSPTPLESEQALFNLTTHQVSRNLYIRGEKSPMVFLLNGFALCDQQAKILSRLLYFKGIPSRAIPLFFDSGRSNHTILEWHDGQNWVVSDPFLHFPINIPAPAFCVLDMGSARSDSHKKLIHRAHDYFASNQDLLQELRETYTRPNHAVWDFFRGKPAVRLLESMLSLPLEIAPKEYLDLLNATYRLRHDRRRPLMSHYHRARHQELMGQCKEALDGYRTLLPKVKAGGRPKDLHFELDLEMLKWRIVANRRYCAMDHSTIQPTH